MCSPWVYRPGRLKPAAAMPSFRILPHCKRVSSLNQRQGLCTCIAAQQADTLRSILIRIPHPSSLRVK